MFRRLFLVGRHIILLLAVSSLFAASAAYGQGTAFSYQGRLADSGNPADGLFDMQFKLFDTATVGIGTQQGATITNSSVQVTDGAFSVQLDFAPCASCFNGSARFLEIGIRPAGSMGSYTVLVPRQPVASAPYAVRSLAAAAADGLSVACVSCVTSSQIVSVNGSAVNGAIPVASVPAGSANYIQNTTSQQAGANFTISGDGTAGGTLSAAQYNIGASRVLSTAGSFGNLFVGVGAGQSNPTSCCNSFFGHQAGLSNMTGQLNSFFGKDAGFSNTDGSFNSFFGVDAGQANIGGGLNSFFGYGAGQDNTTGSNNSFFGANAGSSNTTGNSNSFFGRVAGFSNTEGFSNSFFGLNAGRDNTTGDLNSFFGVAAGVANTTGNDNSFFGRVAGDSNTTGSNNTVIGASADLGANNLSFATAIGSGAVVSNSNSVVLGRAADTVRIPGSLVISTLGAATATHLCINAGLVSNCSSSLRYKEHLAPFTPGIELINRLRPITFNWKQGGMRDLGLAAEEVAEVEPLLVTYNERGQVEGVKYDRINIALVNAVRQQQEQINRQQTENEELKQQLKQQEERLRRLEAAMDDTKKK